MTILQKRLPSGDGHAARGWHWFGHRDQAVRYTEAWEHETFAEEQARWERSDPEYARICAEVRQAKDRGGEAWRRADQAKAEWDARTATQRQADDDVQEAHHVSRDSEAHHHLHTTFADESNDSPAAGLMPGPVRVHGQPAATPAPRDERQAPRLCFRGLAIRSPVSNEPTRLEVE